MDLTMENDSVFNSKNSIIPTSTYIDEFSFETKCNVLETIWSMEGDKYTLEKKEKIRKELLTNSPKEVEPLWFSDTLEACLPDKDKKGHKWKFLISRHGYVTIEQYTRVIRGFARKEQYELLKDYFQTHFFEYFDHVKKTLGLAFAEVFYEYLNPSFIIEQKVSLFLNI